MITCFRDKEWKFDSKVLQITILYFGEINGVHDTLITEQSSRINET